MSKRVVCLDAPLLGDLEKKYLNRAIDGGYVSTIGPFVQEFEKRFANYLEISKAVALQSGTAALHLSLYELGIRKGDEVIVPALTFVATVNPILYVGATPVFVDVDIETWNINLEEVERKINENTKAIIAVHLYGNPCMMEKLTQFAKENGLYLIEDATESLGALYKGKFTGTFGDFGCFSFNGNKLITTGGGGIIVGKDEQRLEHIRFLANQARDVSKGYYHPEPGFNYRMTNIEAALGLAQMERIDSFIEKKRMFNNIYREELKPLKVRFQKEYEEARSVWWLNCIFIEKDVNVLGVQKELLKYGIQTRRVFMPLVECPMYQDDKEKYNNSYLIYEHGLCLPSSVVNSEDDVYYVCNIIKQLLN